MIIDNVDISYYGLQLLTVKDFLDLPRRKEILSVPAFTANDIQTESLSFKIELYGKWKSTETEENEEIIIVPSFENMEIALNGFGTLITSTLKHFIEIPEYGFNVEDAVFPDGYSVEFWEIGKLSSAKITAKITLNNANRITLIEEGNGENELED